MGEGLAFSVYFDVRMPTRWPQAILALAKDFRGKVMRHRD